MKSSYYVKGKAVRNLRQLLLAARAVSPDCEVKFRGTGEEDKWICIVSVGAATLFESKAGYIDDVVDDAARKMKGVSQRMKAALDDPGGSSPPPSSAA